MQGRGGKSPQGARVAAGRRSHDARGRLVALADQLGNDAMADRIARGHATQQDMVAYVTARLAQVAEIQHREWVLTQRTASHWAEWRAMGDSHVPRTHEAAPTRWEPVARAWDAAVRAACRGELPRARQLVVAARALEDRVRDDTTDLVRTDDVQAGSPDPAWLADAVLSSTQPVDVPAETEELVRRIVRVTAEMPQMRGKPRTRLPWWAEEEDEHEEEDDEDG